MYRLYWHPNASSYAPMAALEELGVEFELHEVDYEGGETRTLEYRQLQPLGLIPALRLEDGCSMFESAAIILYLCDRHLEAELAPGPDSELRPHYLQWLFFMADTIYPSYNRYYHPERYTSAADSAAEVREQAGHTVKQQWQVVEDALSQNGPWMLGKRFSAADIYLQMLSTWHDTPSQLLGAHPRVRELAGGVVMRDGCQRALRRHNFETGLE